MDAWQGDADGLLEADGNLLDYLTTRVASKTFNVDDLDAHQLSRGLSWLEVLGVRLRVGHHDQTDLVQVGPSRSDQINQRRDRMARLDLLLQPAFDSCAQK